MLGDLVSLPYGLLQRATGMEEMSANALFKVMGESLPGQQESFRRVSYRRRPAGMDRNLPGIM